MLFVICVSTTAWLVVGVVVVEVVVAVVVVFFEVMVVSSLILVASDSCFVAPIRIAFHLSTCDIYAIYS